MNPRRLSTAIIIIGIALIIGAAGLAFYNIWTDAHAGEERDVILTELADYMPEEPEDESGEPEETPELVDPMAPLPVVDVDGKGYLGSLSIPKLKLELPVQSEYDYDSLKIAPSVYYGSIATGDLVICAHNYRTHFGALKNLGEGDQVLFRDMNGLVYTYEVGATEIVSPFAVADVTSGEWDLTLFTCTLGGRTRLVIRCDRVDV